MSSIMVKNCTRSGNAITAITQMTNQARQRLAALVRSRREAMKLTQSELAERIGCSREQITAIEAGRVQLPSPEIAKGLERELGISEQDILRTAGYLTPEEKPSGAPSAEEEAELAMYRQLDRDPYIAPDVREILKRIVREEHQRWKEKQRKKEEGG